MFQEGFSRKWTLRQILHRGCLSGSIWRKSIYGRGAGAGLGRERSQAGMQVQGQLRPTQGVFAANSGPSELSEWAKMARPLSHQALWSVSGSGPPGKGVTSNGDSEAEGALLAAKVSHRTLEGRSGLHISIFITKGKLRLGWEPLLVSSGTSIERHNLTTSHIRSQSSSSQAQIRKGPSISPLASS